MTDVDRTALTEPGFNLQSFPWAVAILALAAFIPSYIVAVILGHIYPFWPYISDTGTTKPESCIFGFFLAWTGFAALIVFYVRYKQVHLTLRGDGCCKIVNDVALLLGLLSSIGMVMVSAFQEEAVFAAHVTGAALAFGCGTVYIFMQTFLSSKLSETYRNSRMVTFRFLLGVLALVTAIFMLANYITAYEFLGDNNSLHWKPGEDGYVNHVCSTISEWVVAFVFLVFMLTFYKEFKTCKFEFIVNVSEQPTIFAVSQNYGSVVQAREVKA